MVNIRSRSALDGGKIAFFPPLKTKTQSFVTVTLCVSCCPRAHTANRGTWASVSDTELTAAVQQQLPDLFLLEGT